MPPIEVDGFVGEEDDWYDLDFESGIDEGDTAWCDEEVDDGSYDSIYDED